MRGVDVDTTGRLWIYRPGRHKRRYACTSDCTPDMKTSNGDAKGASCPARRPSPVSANC
jgi:hypothetical protein